VTNQNQAGAKLCGRFVLIDKLGAGGYGEVWRARDELRDTDIALKILYSQFRESEPACRCSSGEFTLTARLNHPGVLRVYEPVRGEDATVLPMVLPRAVTCARCAARRTRASCRCSSTSPRRSNTHTLAASCIAT